MLRKMLDSSSELSNSNKKVQCDKKPPTRVYKNWKGNNKFFLGGRFIFGPDVRSMFFTIFLIVVPITLFVVFVSQELVSEFDDDTGNFIVVVSILFAAFVLFFLLLTSSRDPGIIPRNERPPEPEEGSSSINSSEWAASQNSVSSLPPTKDVEVNNIIVKVKFCNTCLLYRPPRCSHCSICNNCVERFDHHCPWVGQCIGKRNYRYFFMFVSSTTLLCIYVLFFCCANLVKIIQTTQCKLWEAVIKSPVSGILIVYTFIAAWFVGGLTAFHLYLVSKNQTTYENFRSRYDGKINPYNRGFIKNVGEIFFSQIPTSQHNFRQKVKPGNNSLSFGQSLVEARQAVAEEDITNLSSKIGSVKGLERCETQPTHPMREVKKDSWKNNKDIEAFAAELGMEHGFKSVKGLERCETQPTHPMREVKKDSWKNNKDIEAFAAELGMEHGFKNDVKTQDKL